MGYALLLTQLAGCHRHTTSAGYTHTLACLLNIISYTLSKGTSINTGPFSSLLNLLFTEKGDQKQSIYFLHTLVSFLGQRHGLSYKQRTNFYSYLTLKHNLTGISTWEEQPL